MSIHLPAAHLTSGLDSLASVSTRAVALTAWANSCSTSLWVLAASRILGRNEGGNHRLVRAIIIISASWKGTIMAIIPTSCLSLSMGQKPSFHSPSLPPSKLVWRFKTLTSRIKKKIFTRLICPPNISTLTLSQLNVAFVENHSAYLKSNLSPPISRNHTRNYNNLTASESSSRKAKVFIVLQTWLRKIVINQTNWDKLRSPQKTRPHQWNGRKLSE